MRLRRLLADAAAEIRLKPSTNTCMLRNAHPIGGTERPVTLGADQFRNVPGDALIRVISQQPNPDYPKTTPKGGTGKGIWVR